MQMWMAIAKHHITVKLSENGKTYNLLKTKNTKTEI